ncbi:MAG: radical SAM protein [Anaerolineaceae bacterium]|jgi:putative pyruvate formate lyase activating enzyme
MALTRRNFIARMCLAAGAVLLKACTPARETPPTPIGTTDFQPAYIKLEAENKFADRVQQAFALLESCEICPRRCGVNRLEGRIGLCQAPEKVVVHSFSPHFGEELPLVGRNGSGTIFFSNCNLRCVFCQNWPIAHEGRGTQITNQRLAELMLDLQRIGCHNINLVTPTHVMPHILEATRIAMQRGLNLPLCYNTSGYECAEIIKLLDGIVDIYLPDFKFWDGAEAERYNLAAAYDYPVRAKESILEMHRQVGDLVTDENGIALRGLMIRHLVMPNRVAGTQGFVQWVADNLPKNTYVNIMSQYRVEFKAFEYELIARAITSEEFIEAIGWAKEAGLTNLDERSLAHYDIHRMRMQ